MSDNFTGTGSGSGDNDEAVQLTNDDATVCKQSAINLGYWPDPFLQYFTLRSGLSPRKAPEINRGYWARTQGIYSLIVKSIRELARVKEDEKGVVCQIQIVNLGAGFDTLYWRLKNDKELQERNPKFAISSFVDVDFPVNTAKKVGCIVKHTKDLLKTIDNESESEVKISRSELHTNDYHIIGVDLRNLKQVEEKLKSCGLQSNLPTIYLSECVLVYMEPSASQDLLGWISRNFPTCVFINYEQVNMSDNFANIMLQNLNMRGCNLLGVDHCKDLETQRKRFETSDWSSVRIWTMNQVYASLPPSEIKRIEKIEMLDEKELLNQLLEHYCILVAINNDPNSIHYSIGFDQNF